MSITHFKDTVTVAVGNSSFLEADQTTVWTEGRSTLSKYYVKIQIFLCMQKQISLFLENFTFRFEGILEFGLFLW